MSLHKVKVYSKLIAIVVLALVAVLFMIANRHLTKVNILWFTSYELPTYAFVFIVANAGIFIFLVIRRVRKIITDVRHLRREERARRELAGQLKQQMAEKPDSPKE